jgi:hypothetical protein
MRAKTPLQRLHREVREGNNLYVVLHDELCGSTRYGALLKGVIVPAATSCSSLSRCTQNGSSALSVQIKERKSPAINNL